MSHRVRAVRKIRTVGHKVRVGIGDWGTITDMNTAFGRPSVLFDNGVHVIVEWSEIEIVQLEE